MNRDTCILTLVGMADSAGRITRWSASEAYAYARLDKGAFEDELASLERDGLVAVDRSKGRRRFLLVADLMKRKTEADRFMQSNRNRVANTLAGDVATTTIRIEALEPLAGKTRPRIGFRLIMPGNMKIEHCAFIGGDKPFVVGPSRFQKGGQPLDLVTFELPLAAEIRAAVELEIERNPVLMAQAQALLNGRSADN